MSVPGPARRRCREDPLALPEATGGSRRLQGLEAFLGGFLLLLQLFGASPILTRSTLFFAGAIADVPRTVELGGLGPEHRDRDDGRDDERETNRRRVIGPPSG